MLNIYTSTELVAIQPVNTTANPAANVTTMASVARLSGKPRIYMLGLKFFPNFLHFSNAYDIMMFKVFSTLSYLDPVVAVIERAKSFIRALLQLKKWEGKKMNIVVKTNALR